MSVSPFALDASWRDYYGMWNPIAEPRIALIDKSDCHLPRLALLPDALNNVVPSGGKISYNFHLKPGSLIYGIWTGQSTNQDMAIQLTDVNLGHPFFQAPLTSKFLATQGANQGRFPSMFPLPTPHPVVGDGLFTFEACGDPDDVAIVILAVAEASECPAK